MILMGIPRRRQHLPPPTPTPPLRQHRHLHRAYAPPPNHRPRRIPILPPPQHLRHPRALLIAAGALTLVALTVVLGPTVGLPLGLLVPESFAEYSHGPPPPPPPPPPSSDPSSRCPPLNPPPSPPRARYALKTSRPPPRGFDAFYAFARAPERGCLVTACTPTLRHSGRLLDPRRTRGPPKGSIDTIEAWLRQTEALVGILLAAAWRRGGRVGGFGRGLLYPRHTRPASTTAPHSTPPPTIFSAHKVSGAINAGRQGWLSGVNGVSSSFSLRAPWLSFRPSSLLSSCCAEVACRGGAYGAVARRRGRDGGIAVGCSHCDPRKARAHRRGTTAFDAGMPCFSLRVMGARVSEPRASSRAAESVLTPAPRCAYAYPPRLLPCFLRIMRLVLLLLFFLLLLHPRDSFPCAFAFGLFTYFLHLHHISVHAHAQYTHPIPLSFRARVRVQSGSESSCVRRVRHENEGVPARRGVLRE
ncbi:hypothetical protein DFH09DRAFT_1477781 [Mycena vulgaris]|nr:hypothetical protein DFH09DRAFT_1477781 [Mycena vulgaris]